MGRNKISYHLLNDWLLHQQHSASSSVCGATFSMELEWF